MKGFLVGVFFMVLAVGGAGCRLFDAKVPPVRVQPSTVPEEKEIEPLTALPPIDEKTSCRNPYAPFQIGTSIIYRTKFGEDIRSYAFRVTSNDTRTVETTYDMEGNVTTTFKQLFACDGASVRALAYLDMGNVLSGQPIKLQTESVDGELLPAELKPGSSWQTTYVVNVSSDDPRLREQLKGLRQRIEVKQTALESERLTTAAGTFDTIKVASETTVKQEGVEGGSSFTIPMTIWYAKGLGLVKETAGGSGTPWSLEATGLSP